MKGGGVGCWRWRLGRSEHLLELLLGGSLGIVEVLEGQGGVGARGLGGGGAVKG